MTVALAGFVVPAEAPFPLAASAVLETVWAASLAGWAVSFLAAGVLPVVWPGLDFGRLVELAIFILCCFPEPCSQRSQQRAATLSLFSASVYGASEPAVNGGRRKTPGVVFTASALRG
jgi:hypothetical protein